MGSNQKIKVCHLASGDLWAGAESQILTLLSHLNQDPSLELSAVILNQGELASGLRESGVEVHLIEESGRGFFEILGLIEERLRGKDLDLLHSHRYKENILAAMLKRRGIARHIVQTVHGKSEPFKGFNRIRATVSKAINRYCTRNYFDRIITVSIDIKHHFPVQVHPDKVVAIHNSINTSLLKPSKSSDEVRDELGIEAGRPVIGTAGRLVPVKGYDILLDAAKTISEHRPDVVFVLAGDGPLRKELESKARSLGLQESCLFAGFRRDIVNLINIFDILVMSSHSEGIPIILLEAMGMGKPVVATAVGGITEVVETGVSGRLVSKGDANALSDACLEVLQDAKLGQRLGQKAKERIEAEFTVENQCRAVAQLYRNVAGRS